MEVGPLQADGEGGGGRGCPGLRPSRTLAGALLVVDVGEDGAFGWREAPTSTHRKETGRRSERSSRARWVGGMLFVQFHPSAPALAP